uniref:Cytochrome b n=1 Tax=Aplidium conicum TaxID=286149 RepID=D1GKZ4_APLCO|nr:cytochrome b [Aplidium conicum]CAX68848.1 cytochrome b [Aplidium conicum]
MLRKDPLVSLFYGSFVRLPSPVNISYFWNFGSCVGFFLIVQILTGLFLSMHYSPDVNLSFDSLTHIIMDVNFGWSLRYIHMNGASMFLALIYLHTSRGLYYKRYGNFHAWSVGVLMLALSMLSAFLGYVLPWGQMSFWGATVITNMISALPVYGTNVVYWLWGGYSVAGPTLSRFFTFHFIFPLIIAFLALIHLYFIHGGGGSGNPLGMFSDSYKISFWPYYGYKDILGLIFLLFFFLINVFFFSDTFSDPDNYTQANPLVTPVHIKPEWYFLFAYAMLRSIPNKLLGVLSLVFSILVFFFMPLGNSKLTCTLIYQILFWMWVFNFIMLTWLGGCPVKDVFNYLSQLGGIVYFLLLFFLLFT